MLKYSEDLNFASNKDMGPKGFFEMACNNHDFVVISIVYSGAWNAHYAFRLLGVQRSMI
jgi:hypothetical protein